MNWIELLFLVPAILFGVIPLCLLVGWGIYCIKTGHPMGTAELIIRQIKLKEEGEEE